MYDTFVIVRKSDDKYVASEHQCFSHTRDLRKAKIFHGEMDALVECEDGYSVEPLASQLSLGPVVPLGAGLRPVPA